MLSNLSYFSLCKKEKFIIRFRINTRNVNICFFCSEYVPILTRDQRVRYKKEYNTHYNEYLRYHEILRQAKSRFTKLSKQRENLQRGTPEYRVSQFYFSYAQLITFDIDN